MCDKWISSLFLYFIFLVFSPYATSIILHSFLFYTLWFLVFSSLITLFPSLITKKWWDPRREACLDLFSSFVFITQFSDFWVMSYGNWKLILGVFKLRKQSYDGIFVNTHTMRDPPTTTFDSLSFFFFFFFSTFFFLPFRLSHLKPIKKNKNKKKIKNQETRLKGEREGASSSA